MFETKKQKLILKLILWQEVDEDQGIIKYVMWNEKNEVHKMFLAKKIEEFFSVLLVKHLWQYETKFREFF
jgi:hypothetical protein